MGTTASPAIQRICVLAESKEQREDVRAAAIVAAVSICPRLASRFTRSVVTLVNDQRRCEVVAAIARTQTRSALELLLAVIGDRCGAIRQIAVAALWRLIAPEDSDRCKALIGILDDPLEGVRRDALRCLARLEDRPAILTGIGRKLLDARCSVREAAANAVGMLEATGLLEAVGAALLDDNTVNVRVACAEAIGQCGTRAAQCVPALERALSDSNRRVRMSAMRALGNLGSAAKIAVPTVKKHLETAQGRMIAITQSTLQKLTLDANTEMANEQLQ
jgi:HEAT repeat protein